MLVLPFFLIITFFRQFPIGNDKRVSQGWDHLETLVGWRHFVAVLCQKMAVRGSAWYVYEVLALGMGLTYAAVALGNGIHEWEYGTLEINILEAVALQ